MSTDLFPAVTTTTTQKDHRTMDNTSTPENLINKITPSAYFLVVGQVEYLPVKGDKEGTHQYKLVDGIYPSASQVMAAKDLFRVQNLLHRTFLEKRKRTSQVEPEVTDIIITSVSYLGVMTTEQFQAGMPEEETSKG